MSDTTCDCESFEDRVIKEKSQLDERIEKLALFFETSQFDNLPGDQKALLRKQLALMEEYSEVLDDRIKYFPLPPHDVNIGPPDAEIQTSSED